LLLYSGVEEEWIVAAMPVERFMDGQLITALEIMKTDGRTDTASSGKLAGRLTYKMGHTRVFTHHIKYDYEMKYTLTMAPCCSQQIITQIEIKASKNLTSNTLYIMVLISIKLIALLVIKTVKLNMVLCQGRMRDDIDGNNSMVRHSTS
jgi:hypothetical protein